MAGRSLTIVKHGALVERPDGEVVSLRESSVMTLGRLGLLDGPQVDAAFRFRNLWQALDDDPRRHASPSERVGGKGQRKTAEGERVAAARRTLQRVRPLLGVRGFDLVARVCGDGYHIRDLCQSRRERDTATDNLRMHLSDLAAILASAH